MSAARQISRRLGRTTGARTNSALSDCVVRTVLFGSDPLKSVATYGRSLYALVIGLFCGRWALMALGE